MQYLNINILGRISINLDIEESFYPYREGEYQTSQFFRKSSDKIYYHVLKGEMYIPLDSGMPPGTPHLRETKSVIQNFLHAYICKNIHYSISVWQISGTTVEKNTVLFH